MDFRNLLLEKKERVAVLTVNRPAALNALDPATIAELGEALRKLEEDRDVHVVILTGAGDRAFIAGGDISVMVSLGPLEAREAARSAQKLFCQIEKMPKVVIAAINGYALGGGCELAMACDIRLAAESAKIGQPEVNLGIIPGWAGTQRLPRLVGKGIAKQLLFTGDMISARRAMEIGLVNEVYPDDGLLPAARELAARIAAKPQVAVRLIKEAVDNGLEMGSEQAFEYEADLFGLCFATEDQKEGMNAFLQKRPPVWKNQ
ncbi:enoyl-CoA hydratase [Geothermobacter ehrlichii]|uniref:Enoyl-CoA hydratase n=1 Tax=Geothermobacter ehrlichii TaxID=213224 RepID=A0A5D3WIX5_9BACT|nr:enoyl-CoA hydratase-related protein [Geothermobacter ehrlichii]TYO98221.1 enoyl-CoA hydratase [Geothermobacter ehrlichii]